MRVSCVRASWVAIVRCGLHSGIPKCCVRWFVRVWVPYLWTHEMPSKGQSAREIEEHLERRRGRGPQSPHARYIVCPDCVAASREPAVVRGCPRPLRGCCKDFAGAAGSISPG